MDDNESLPIFTDHQHEHEHGRCAEDCPWCLEEQHDLGGEGGGA